MPDTFTIAAIQPFEPRSGADQPQMASTAWKLAEDAAAGGAKLLVFPEYFNVMGVAPAEARGNIENTRLQREAAASFCRDSEVWLLLPLIEKRDNGVFNTAHLFDTGGQIVHTYDKTHLTIGEKRDYGLTAGDRIDTVDTPLGCIGVMICYDVYFPQVSQLLALRGAQIILFPSLQRSDSEENVMMFNRVRAMDATAYFVRSSYGQRRGAAFKPGLMHGGSCVVGPDGSVLANAGHHEGIAAARIDPHTPWQRQRCGGMPPQPVREFLLEDRRPQLYGPISEGQ